MLKVDHFLAFAINPFGYGILLNIHVVTFPRNDEGLLLFKRFPYVYYYGR